MINKTLKAIAECLDNAGIPYMVMGGQAVLQYGEARMTQDIDLTIALTPDDVDRVLPSLKACGFSPVTNNASQFAKETWVLPVSHDETGVRVDVVFSITPFERQAIEGARVIGVEGAPVRFIAPEELVVQKVMSGRPKDIEDVKGIVDIQGDALDKEKIRAALDGLGRELEKPELVKMWDEIIGG